MKPILLVVAPYYKDIADHLVQGASGVLREVNVEFERVDVPGAFEIPAAIAYASTSKKYAGYVALGCIIRGETSHYDHICVETARALMQLSAEHKLAIGNGILTCETEAQARLRANPKEGDKGGWAAKTCLRMIEVRNQFGVA